MSRGSISFYAIQREKTYIIIYIYIYMLVVRGQIDFANFMWSTLNYVHSKLDKFNFEFKRKSQYSIIFTSSHFLSTNFLPCTLYNFTLPTVTCITLHCTCMEEFISCCFNYSCICFNEARVDFYLKVS